MSAVEAVDRGPAPDRRTRSRHQRVHGGARRPGPRRGGRARRRAGRGRGAGPAPRRPGGDQGGDRRRRLRHHVRWTRQHAPRRGRQRGGPPAPRGRRGHRRQDRDAGVRRVALHRVRRRRDTPATRGDPATRPGGSSGGTAVAVAAGHGAGRHRRRRRRLDPDPVGVLRAVRPQAAARPGHHRADGAPVVVARHGRAADPQRCSTRRSSTT